MRVSYLRRDLVSGVGVAVLLCAGVAWGQTKAQKQAAGYDRAARATVLHQANVYVSADANSQRISLVTPGHEVVVIQRSGPWVQVFANTDIGDEASEDDSNVPEFGGDEAAAATTSSGWIRDKGVVNPATAGGDAILFGAAANSEDEAEQPHAPKGAAEAAYLLYKRVSDYFPDSPLAAEAAWRSADIRWRLAKLDISSLPSAKEQDAYLRPQIYEGAMKKVMKMYPGSDFAARSAFEMLDNKLCGDWQGLPKCPEMETGLYVKYAKQYPDGPKAAEALYDATYRQGVVVTMYLVQEDRKRSEAAVGRTVALAEELKERYPKSDYAVRAAAIAYRVQQGIPVDGNDRTEGSRLLVRAIAREDAAAVAELCGQLGYTVSVADVEARIVWLAGCVESQVALVACMGPEVVGWIEAAMTCHLQSAPHVLITGLVVRDGARSLGIGKRLCAEVEDWSRTKGVRVVRVTSRMSREGAHRFYLREGYERTKTSAVFEKILL